MVMNTQPQPKRVGESAVVIGASMAGLSAACVLADRFDHVTVLDHDHLPEHSTWRQQVPQGRHPHLLLAAGARLLEDWCPGIIDESTPAGPSSPPHRRPVLAPRRRRRPPPDLVTQRPIDVTAVPRVDHPPTARIAPRHHHPWRHRRRGPRARPDTDPRRRRATRGRRSGPLQSRRRRDRTPGPQPELACRARLPRTQVARARSTPATSPRSCDGPSCQSATGRWPASSTTRPPNASPWLCPSRATAGWSSSAASTARRPR